MARPWEVLCKNNDEFINPWLIHCPYTKEVWNEALELIDGKGK